MTDRFGRYIAVLGGLILCASPLDAVAALPPGSQHAAAREVDDARRSETLAARRQADVGAEKKPKTPDRQREVKQGYLDKVLQSPGDTFNGIIAVCTVILAAIGLWQAAIARAVARRQLRAYVSVTPLGLHRLEAGNRPQIECIVRNHGLTPAFNIRHYFSMAILPANTPVPPELPPPTQNIETDHTIFPGTSKAWFNYEHDVRASDVASIMSGDNTLWIWGKVEYRDAFRQKHHTEFNAFVDGISYARYLSAISSGKKDVSEFVWTYGNRHNHGN